MPESKHRRRGRTRTRRRTRTTSQRGGISSSTEPGAKGKGRASLITPRRTRFGWILLVGGGVVFIQHLLSHLGLFTVMSRGADDLVIGYPTAAILAFIGVLMLGWFDWAGR